jgi:phage replication O-like protein O
LATQEHYHRRPDIFENTQFKFYQPGRMQPHQMAIKIGASPHKSNFTQIEHLLLETLAASYLSPSEAKLIFALLRKTCGWHKDFDWISYSQFRAMTNLNESQISRGLNRLQSRQIVVKIPGEHPEYGINTNYTAWLSVA